MTTTAALAAERARCSAIAAAAAQMNLSRVGAVLIERGLSEKVAQKVLIAHQQDQRYPVSENMTMGSQFPWQPAASAVAGQIIDAAKKAGFQ